LNSEWQPTGEEDLVSPFREFWNDDLETVKAAQLFDLQTYLPNDILTKVDRASMYFGIEARVPMLSRSMIQLALRMPTSLHNRAGRRKHILKEAIRPRVPESLLSNRKKGFGLPLESALGERLRQFAAGFDSSAVVRDGLIARGALPRISANLDQLWALFALEVWWNRWIGSPAAVAAS
jgi:asparagine synthase (glutamine-hydrolysing)